MLRYVERFQTFLKTKKIRFLRDFNKTSVTVMKGQLFQFFAIIDKIEKYYAINNRVINQKNKVTRDLLKVDIVVRNSIAANRRLFSGQSILW